MLGLAGLSKNVARTSPRRRRLAGDVAEVDGRLKNASAPHRSVLNIAVSSDPPDLFISISTSGEAMFISKF